MAVPIETSVSQAAYFFAIDDTDPIAVREQLRNFIADCETTLRNENGKSSDLRLKGARAGLRECEPWRAGVEAAAALAELEALRKKIPAEGTRFRFESRKVTGMIAALPPGDEREYLQMRLDELNPPPPPPVDPGAAIFEDRMRALHEGLARTPVNLASLRTLLAEAESAGRFVHESSRPAAEARVANAQAQVENREREARVSAEAEKAERERKEAALQAERLKIEREREALEESRLKEEAEKADRERREAAAQAEKLRIEREREALEEVRRQAAEEAERQAAAAEKIAALQAALQKGDAARAAALLAEARTMALGLHDPETKKFCQAEIYGLAARLTRLTEEILAYERRNQARAEIAAIDGLLEGGKLDEAEGALGGARMLVEALADRTSREDALEELVDLSDRLRSLRESTRRSVPDNGRRLRLSPNSGSAPLVFVARDRFLLGREEKEKPSRADFLAPKEFLQVGRGNVLLTRRDDEIFVQDGDEKGKSTNGSRLDTEVLTTIPRSASFARDRSIVMSGIFTLIARHLPGDAPAGPPVKGPVQPVTLGRTVVINSLTGAMRFTPKTEAKLPVVSVWLFTDATIGAAPECAVALPHSGLADFHARIHYWENGFWIENLRSGAAVRLGDHPLATGETLPLRQGDRVQLGPVVYVVSVDD